MNRPLVFFLVILSGELNEETGLARLAYMWSESALDLLEMETWLLPELLRRLLLAWGFATAAGRGRDLAGDLDGERERDRLALLMLELLMDLLNDFADFWRKKRCEKKKKQEGET